MTSATFDGDLHHFEMRQFSKASEYRLSPMLTIDASAVLTSFLRKYDGDIFVRFEKDFKQVMVAPFKTPWNNWNVYAALVIAIFLS